MDLLERNVLDCLPFSSPHISGNFIAGVRNYHIANRTIVVNPNPTVAYLDRFPQSIIPPFSSTILEDVSIKQADSVILFEVIDTDNIADIIFESGWNLLGDLMGTPASSGDSQELPYPLKTPLWKSAQSTICEIEFDPYVMTDSKVTALTRRQKFSVKVNLWFAPAHTNCFIHNQHDFIEIHSQIFGRGRMQKFTAQDPKTLYEDILMSPGYTTSLPFCSVESDNFIYPWHQYYADTDCIWMAIEYHLA